MVRPIAVCACLALLLSSGARAQSAPPQPTLPSPPAKSPTVETMLRPEQPSLVVRKAPRHRIRVAQRRHHRWAGRLPPLARPALAGVALVEPLPPLREPPHIRVPVPAYPPETLAYWLNTPRPDIVCAPAPRDPSEPDPRLYRERPVVCEPDNP